MKTAVIIQGDIKQVVLTAETEEERAIVKLFHNRHDLAVHHDVHFEVEKCHGGYLREFNNDYSVALVLIPKPTELPAEPPGQLE